MGNKLLWYFSEGSDFLFREIRYNLRKRRYFRMCTAATYQTKDFYFGRTLDYEFSYGNQVVITPRNYAFPFRHEEERINAVCDNWHGMRNGQDPIIL